MRQGRHIEGVAQWFSPTQDEHFGLPLTGLPGDRRQLGKARDLFALEPVDFGHKIQHSRYSDFSGAGDGSQDIAVACGGLTTCNEGGDLSVKLGDLAFRLSGRALVLRFRTAIPCV